jgi:hypothetical protein
VDWDPSGGWEQAYSSSLYPYNAGRHIQAAAAKFIQDWWLCIITIIMLFCCLLLSLLWTVSTCPATTFKNHADETFKVSCAERFLGIMAQFPSVSKSSML